MELPLLSALSRHWDFVRVSRMLCDSAPSRVGQLVKELIGSKSPDERQGIDRPWEPQDIGKDLSHTLTS